MKHATEHSHCERCLGASSWEGSRFQRSRPLGHKCRDRMGVMGVTNIRPHDCWLEIIGNRCMALEMWNSKPRPLWKSLWPSSCWQSWWSDLGMLLCLIGSYWWDSWNCPGILISSILAVLFDQMTHCPANKGWNDWNSTSRQSVNVMLMTPSMVVNGKASCRISARNTLHSIEMLKLMTGYDQSKMQHLSHWNLSFYPILLSILSLATVWKAASRWDPSCPGCKARSSGQGIPWSRLGVRVQLLCASKVSWSGKSGVIFRSSNQPQSAIQILVTCLTLMSQVSDTDPMQLSDLVAVAIYTPPCKLKPSPNDSADGDWIKAVSNIPFRTPLNPLMCNPTCLLQDRFPHHLRSLEVRQSWDGGQHAAPKTAVLLADLCWM